MKILLIFLFSFSIFAHEYQFENIIALDNFDYESVIYEDDKKVILIMNNGNCFGNNRSCYRYEKKINALAPQIKARGFEIYNLDVSFHPSHQRYNIQKLPAVLFIQNGSLLKILEPNTCNIYERHPDCRMRNLTWVNYLLQETLDTITQFL